MKTDFTVIYVDSWQSGSHRTSLTKMRRVSQYEGETVAEMLRREGLESEAVFIFYGHPRLEGSA